MPETDDEHPAERERTRVRSTMVRAIPAVLVALPFGVVALRILIRRGDPVYSGDAALLELAVHRAADGSQLLGPYSRFEFFHPGPLMFYVFAPFEFLTGGAPWAMPFAVSVFNMGVAIVIVLFVQRSVRSCGVLAGASTALVLLAYAMAVDFGLLQLLWNPIQIVLPMALLLVAAGVVNRAAWSVALVALAGTYVMQSHVGTGPLVIAAGACAITFLVLEHRHDPLRIRYAVAFLTVVVLAWLPPIYQQATAKPGNIGRLISFFRDSPGDGPGWDRSFTYVGRELAIFPARMPWVGELTPETVGGLQGLAGFVAFIAIATLLIVVGARRQHRDGMRLGIVALVSALVSVYAVASISGPVYWYLTAYMTAIAVPLALGWLLILIDAFPGASARAVPAALVVVAMICTVIAATVSLYDNRSFPNEPKYRADTEAAWNLLEPNLAAFENKRLVLGGDETLMPTLAGVALKLEHAGYNVRVPDALVPKFGPERRASNNAPADIVITVNPVDGYRVIGLAPAKMTREETVTVSVRDTR